MSVLVTEGMGCIGSHTVVEGIEAGYDPIIIIDNLSDSKIKVLDRLEKIARKRCVKSAS